MRIAFVLPLLFACSESFEDRKADLDAMVTVHCGALDECESAAEVEAVIACLEDARTAAEVEAVIACLEDARVSGVSAEASWIVDIDPVAFVYVVDDEYAILEGYYDDDVATFTEHRCQSVELVNVGSPSFPCVAPRTRECVQVDSWGY